MDTERLERFSPVMLQNILTALRRFEPDLYSHLCRRYHLDAERMLGLFSEIETTGLGQVPALLSDLRGHTAYHEIVFLAGRNALHAEAERQQFRFVKKARDSAQFQSALKQLLPPFLGRASYTMLVRGELYFVELRESIFARKVWHHNPVCGFYAGLLAELGTNCVESAATAAEIRCVANDPEAPSCMFRVGL